MYYFLAFATLLGWPVLVSGDGGVYGLIREVQQRMVGSKRFGFGSVSQNP